MFNGVKGKVFRIVLATSLIVNVGMSYTVLKTKGELANTELVLKRKEESLSSCETSNQRWSQEFSLLKESCDVQTDIMTKLYTKLRKEQNGNGSDVRDILFLEDSKDCKPTMTGEEDGKHVKENTIRLDNNIPDSLYNVLQQAYERSKNQAIPYP